MVAKKTEALPSAVAVERVVVSKAEIDRFWKRARRKRGVRDCWLGFSSDPTTYSRVTVGGRNWQAHRAAFAIEHNGLQANLDVLHRCDVKGCVNPEHLFLGNDSANRLDAGAKEREGLQPWFRAKKFARSTQVCHVRLFKADVETLKQMAERQGTESWVTELRLLVRRALRRVVIKD